MRVSPKWLPPLLLLLSVRPSVAEDVLSGYVSPETKVVFGLQMRTIAPALAQNLGPELVAKTKLAGFDPLKDLDELIVTTSGTGENPPMLAILRGRFDVEKMGRGARRYAGVPMVEVAAQANGVMALLDASTALAGDPALVRAAIDRKKNGVESTGAWADRIEALRSTYAVWGVGEGVESVDRFQFGAQFADGLDLTAELHVASKEEMDKLASGLRMLEAMAQGGQTASGGTRFKMTTENGMLRLSLRIPAEEFKKTIQSQRGTLEAAVKSRLSMGAKPAGPPPEARIVTNDKGETTTVTLPGARR